MTGAHVESVNIAREAAVLPYVSKPSGIGKLPVDEAVEIREPGSQRDGVGSGLAGDVIGNHKVHGGTFQAVYAFARESLDAWADQLGMRPPAGYFGENLTTQGIDVDGARLGERWRIGDEVVLQVTEPRIPCKTFRGWVDVPGWQRLFTETERPGRVPAGDQRRSGPGRRCDRGRAPAGARRDDRARAPGDADRPVAAADPARGRCRPDTGAAEEGRRIAMGLRR